MSSKLENINVHIQMIKKLENVNVQRCAHNFILKTVMMENFSWNSFARDTKIKLRVKELVVLLLLKCDKPNLTGFSD